LDLTQPRVRWNWIIGWKSDLVWYIGSALAGWLYVVLVLYLGRGLRDPLHDAFYTLTFGGRSLDLNLYLVVFVSWAFLVDSPHLWATLARTYLDPDAWVRHRRELLRALLFFGLGPLTVMSSYFIGLFAPLGENAAAKGEELYFAFFRLWAYQHVVRQHWGFLSLYKRKNDDGRDPIENRADCWFFNLALYLPLAMFVSAPWYSDTGFPHADAALLGGVKVVEAIHAACFVLYVTVAVGYVSFQFVRWLGGVERNGPKLLFLASIVPLHFMVFAEPLLGYFIVPIVTVGHNLQYHRIVWSYGQNKYAGDTSRRYRWTRPVFRNVWLYIGLGALFTFALHRGPWVDFLEDTLSAFFDRWVVGGIGLVAGLNDIAGSGIGAQAVGLLFTGWSLHHYYLDGKIWHVNRDPSVARSLNA